MVNSEEMMQLICIQNDLLKEIFHRMLQLSRSKAIFRKYSTKTEMSKNYNQEARLTTFQLTTSHSQCLNSLESF